MNEIARRSDIMALQEELLQRPQVDMPLRHYFAPGVYCRELTVPRGVCAIGKIHKTEHLSILSQGWIYVITESSEAFYAAPATILAQPGVKRAVFVPLDSPADAVWTTIHPSNETDLEKLEAELIAPSYEDFQRYIEGRSECLGQSQES